MWYYVLMKFENFNAQKATAPAEAKVDIDLTEEAALAHTIRENEDKKMGPGPADAAPALLEERREVFRARAEQRKKQNPNNGFKKAA